jgi:hypothetical protein
MLKLSHFLSWCTDRTDALRRAQALALSSAQPSHAVCAATSVFPKTQGPTNMPFPTHGCTHSATQRTDSGCTSHTQHSKVTPA